MPRPFAVTGFTLLFILYILFAVNSDTVLIAVSVLLGAVFILGVSFQRIRKERVIPCSAAVGLVACLLFYSAMQFDYGVALSLAGDRVNSEIRILNYSYSENGRTYYEAESISINGVEYETKLRLSLQLPLDAEPYDTVSGDFVFNVLGSRNAEILDYFKSTSTFLGAYPADFSNDALKVTAVDEAQKPLAYRFVKIRKDIKTALSSLLPGETGALAVALLLGDKARLPESVNDSLRDIGVSHLICVSGMHLSVWSLLVLKASDKLKLGKKVASAVSVVFVLLFMFLSGFTYSVTRAGIMLIITLLGNIFSREKDGINSLGFAVALILVAEPFAAGNVSFLLSVLSTLGMLVLYPEIRDRTHGLISKIRISFVRKPVEYFAGILTGTFSCVVFTLPVCIYYFNSINFLTFISNVFIIPVATVCMVSAGITAAFSFLPLVNVLKYPLGLVCGVAAKLIIATADKLKKFDSLTFYPEKGLILICLSGCLIIMGLAVLFSVKSKLRIRLASLLCAAVFLSSVILSHAYFSPLVNITVADIGNASAVLISKGRKGIMIGCGEDDFYSSEQINYMLEDCHVSELEMLMLPRINKTESGCCNKFLLKHRPLAVACDELPEGSALLLNDVEKTGFNGLFGDVFESGNFTCVSNSEASFAYLQIYSLNVVISFYPSTDLSEYDLPEPDIMICRADLPYGFDANVYDLVVLADTDCLRQNSLLLSGVNTVATAGEGNVRVRISEEGKYTVDRL